MQKYRLIEQIGSGGFSITWRAQARSSQAKSSVQYVVKELCLDKIDHWKAVEQFEREARVLSYLKHPNIPEFVDFIEEDQAGRKRVFLVQSLIKGRDLDALIQSGKHFTEEEVIAIAQTLTEVLVYLQDFSPPIIHRDIKPSNIMLSDADKHVYLIDFGAVKGPAKTDAEQGMTVTGTFGYMPIEQAEGQAVPATDIYALGMTLVYILSHTNPARLPKQGLKVDFRPYVNISEHFAKIIDKMIEPDLKKRYASAQDLQADFAKLQQRKQPRAQQKSWRPLALASISFGLIAIGANYERILRDHQSEAVQITDEIPVSMTNSEHKRLADQYYESEQWSKAVDAYQTYLKAVPTDTEALFRLGYCAGKHLDHETAVTAYLKLEQQDPQAYSVLPYNLGYNYYKLAKIPQAIGYFSQMLLKDSKHLGSLNYLGLIYLEKGNLALAKTYFDKVLAIDPDYKYSLNNYGSLYQQQKQFDQALLFFQRATASDPDYLLPYYHQAEIYHAQKKESDCVRLASQAIEKSGTYASAYNLRGLCYRSLKQPEAAIKDFKKATQASPTYATAYYNMGLVYDDEKNLEQAAHHYQAALKIQPDHHRSLNNLGFIYERQKKYELALTQYSAAIKSNPWAKYYDNRGGIYKLLNQCDLASVDWNMACKKGRTSACKESCS